jgi:superfamily II DNA or RNA helicase
MDSLGPKTTNLHISSKKTAGQRSVLFWEFVVHKRALMTNARCLTEGVDVPAIDCVMFADPKQSRVDIVQAAGRALRHHALWMAAVTALFHSGIEHNAAYRINGGLHDIQSSKYCLNQIAGSLSDRAPTSQGLQDGNRDTGEA